MPATLAKPLATFVHVLVSTICLTSLPHVYRNLQSSRACHDSCATECFTILDSVASKFQIKIKEALHIKWENSILHQQLKHLDLSPSFKLCCSFFSFILLFLLSARLFCFPRISDSNCNTMQVLKPNFRKCFENNAMFTSDRAVL